MNRAEISRAAGASAVGETPTALLLHLHDEANMRMKSFELEADEKYRLNGGVIRARSSKIQGHAMEVQVGVGSASQPIEVYTELEPMLRKDAPTIATTIIQRATDVIGALRE
eukprot:661548-Pyramimonas_sp.AAC.1